MVWVCVLTLYVCKGYSYDFTSRRSCWLVIRTYLHSVTAIARAICASAAYQSEVNACARHHGCSRKRESLSKLDAKPRFLEAGNKKFCTSNPTFILQLLAQQTAIEAHKQTSSRLSSHTALGESPRTPLLCKDRRKAPPQKHFAALSLRDLHPSLVLACRLYSRLEAVRLGFASRETGPSGLPRKRRRGYESALLPSWISLTGGGRTRGGRSTIFGASWAQGMCKGHSSWSIDMRLLAFRLRMGGTLLDGAYS